MSDCVFKRGGPKKYLLIEDFMTTMHFNINDVINSDAITIYENELYVFMSYAWDGPSGPAIDTDNFMDGSLVHDALYDLIRQGKLSRRKYRSKADKELRIQCKKDGMSFVRRWYTWGAVRVGGYGASGGKLLGLL